MDASPNCKEANIMSPGLAYRAGMAYLAGGLPGNDQQHIIRFKGKFCRWSGSHYDFTSDEEIASAVTRWLARHAAVRTVGKRVQAVTENFVRDVLLAVRVEAEAPPHLQPGAWRDGAPPGAVGPFLATPGGILDLGRLGEPRPLT